jgi:predicted nucleotidyltransferase
MKNLVDLLRWSAQHLDRQHVPWALVGGWAVSIRSAPRFTRDVDIAVAARADSEAESLVAAFTSEGFSIDTLIEQTAVNRLATVRLRPPPSYETGLLLDILFASSGIESEICEEAERIECLPGFIAPVAKIEHLLALKILARDDETRPQDAADILALFEEASDSTITRTRALLRLITERGCHREKDLQAGLDRIVGP